MEKEIDKKLNDRIDLFRDILSWPLSLLALGSIRKGFTDEHAREMINIVAEDILAGVSILYGVPSRPGGAGEACHDEILNKLVGMVGDSVNFIESNITTENFNITQTQCADGSVIISVGDEFAEKIIEHKDELDAIMASFQPLSLSDLSNGNLGMDTAVEHIADILKCTTIEARRVFLLLSDI